MEIFELKYYIYIFIKKLFTFLLNCDIIVPNDAVSEFGQKAVIGNHPTEP